MVVRCVLDSWTLIKKVNKAYKSDLKSLKVSEDLAGIPNTNNEAKQAYKTSLHAICEKHMTPASNNEQ